MNIAQERFTAHSISCPSNTEYTKPGKTTLKDREAVDFSITGCISNGHYYLLKNSEYTYQIELTINEKSLADQILSTFKFTR